MVALLGETSAEWLLSAYAAFRCGLTITTIYATLSPEAMLFGLRQVLLSRLSLLLSNFR